MQQKKLRSRTPELFTLFQRDFLPAWPLILLRAYPRAGWSRPLMRPGPKNNPFGAHRPKKMPRPVRPPSRKNCPGRHPRTEKSPRPVRPRAGWSRRPGHSPTEKRPRQHTLPQAGLSTGAPPNRKTSPGRCAPGLNGLTDRPGPNNLADRYAPRTEKLLRPAASLGCPSLGCPRGVCSSSDASPGGRSAAARYRVVPGSRW